jgi:hypothetical protein
MVVIIGGNIITGNFTSRTEDIIANAATVGVAFAHKRSHQFLR